MKCRGKLAEAVVKTERQYRQNPVIGGIFQVVRYALCPCHHVAVGKDYAFWLSGTSGSVKNGRHIAIDTLVRLDVPACNERVVPGYDVETRNGRWSRCRIDDHYGMEVVTLLQN